VRVTSTIEEEMEEQEVTGKIKVSDKIEIKVSL
jgi:hypothetical protein